MNFQENLQKVRPMKGKGLGFSSFRGNIFMAICLALLIGREISAAETTGKFTENSPHQMFLKLNQIDK